MARTATGAHSSTTPSSTLTCRRACLIPRCSPTLDRRCVAFRGHRTPRTYLDDAFLPDLLEILRLDWPYTAERMSIVDGAMDAQDQIASSLLRYGDRVAVEHPTFPPLIDLLESLGARIVGVPVDTDGIVPDRLAAAIASGADTVFLQTRAQNPTGASLTSQRLEQLASVLKGTDVVAVEDDSAGAISSSRALSLGSYLPQQTIHVRSFSKSHGPDLRLAALSGPSRLVDPITERRRLGQGWTSLLLQSVLLDLLVRPSAVAQVERARATYARRRSALVDALARFGVPIDGRDGLNVWLPVRDESAALIRLAERGIGAAAGTPFSAIHSSEGHLRITAGLIPNRGYEHIAAELTEAATAGARTEPR